MPLPALDSAFPVPLPRHRRCGRPGQRRHPESRSRRGRTGDAVRLRDKAALVLSDEAINRPAPSDPSSGPPGPGHTRPETGRAGRGQSDRRHEPTRDSAMSCPWSVGTIPIPGHIAAKAHCLAVSGPLEYSLRAIRMMTGSSWSPGRMPDRIGSDEGAVCGGDTLTLFQNGRGKRTGADPRSSTAMISTPVLRPNPEFENELRGSTCSRV